MNAFRAYWLGCLLAILPVSLAGQNVAVFPQDYAMEMYFRFYLADCGSDEIRCVWFANNDLQTGWKMTLNLHSGSVETVRDGYDATRVAEHPNPGELTAEKTAALRHILDSPPPTQEVFPLEQCLLIAQRVGAQVKIWQYNRVNPPPLVKQLYDLSGGYISLGEADVRDSLSLTADETEKFAGYARPWTVPRVLAWYQQAKNADDRKFWAHVLAVSGDPRAALALGKNLGQGDQSADLREMASYFFGESAIKDRITPADAQKWFQENRPRLAAQAAILSGQPPPSLPAAGPNCPEVAYHEVASPHDDYTEATVTIDRAGLAHITLQRAVPVQRDFQLSGTLIAQLRKLLDDGKFFTAAEPAAPPASALDRTELTIAVNGQKRTIHATWATDFAPVRAFVAQLTFLTAASVDQVLANPSGSLGH
jgi:hypothetical protein